MASSSGDVPVDYTFKTIIIGESNVGKSSLLEVFVNGRMNEVSRHTVGVSYGARTIAVPTEEGTSGTASSDTAVIRMMCWDTAGQDRFRSVTRSYYRGAVACMAVFALNDRASFERLPQWLNDAKTHGRPDITILIVGNKSDLVDGSSSNSSSSSGDGSSGEGGSEGSGSGEGRQVTMIEASRFAQEQGCFYIETSARDLTNVEPAFFKLARTVLAKVADGKIDVATLQARGGGTPLQKPGAGGADAAAGSGCSC